MRTLIVIALLALLGALGAAAAVYFGLYNVAATEAHFPPTHWVLDKAMRQSVRHRGNEVAVPALDQPGTLARGLSLYRLHCLQCHGAPGVAPEPFALGLSPPPANLAHTARTWPAAELYWVIKHGVRMTGMPAWHYRLSDTDLWAVTAFVHTLPAISPREYRAMAAEVPRAAAPGAHAESEPGTGDANRGKAAMGQYACNTCHEIPGIAGAYVPVGPPLAAMATRKYIGGVLPNTPENMVLWLRAPQKIDPGTAMPDLYVTERDARDMAAYLYTLK